MTYREGRFWQPDVTVATVVVRDGRVLSTREGDDPPQTYFKLFGW